MVIEVRIQITYLKDEREVSVVISYIGGYATIHIKRSFFDSQNPFYYIKSVTVVKEGIMDYIENILRFLIVIFVVIVITRIYMRVAAYVGAKFGMGKFLIALMQKIRSNK